MIKAKKHLDKLYRNPMGNKSRRGYLRLNLNENPDGLPEKFIRTVLAEIDANSLSAYPEYSEVTRKIADHNQVQPENIFLANGSDGAIKCIYDAYITAGDLVLLTDPTFAMYPVYCEMFGATAESIPYEEDFTFPVERLLDAINPGVRMVVLINPNNPTGVFLNQESILRIAQKCNDNEALLVVDEAYFYFFNQTSLPLINTFENLIVLRTFSKLCGLASLRLGYAAASANIITSLEKVKPTFDVNGIAVKMAEQLLDHPEIIEAQIDAVNKGKEVLSALLTAEKIEHRMGAANFVLIRCPGDTEEFAAKMEERNVLVAGGFRQELLKDYLRVTVGCTETMKLFWKEFLPVWKSFAP